MSQVKNMILNFSPIFGDFGANINYEINIVYNPENMLKDGINNTNVVVIPGDITHESMQHLESFYVNTRKWKDKMISYLSQPKEYHDFISTFFNNLPEDFKIEYSVKFDKINEQIAKMKPLQ